MLPASEQQVHVTYLPLLPSTGCPAPSALGREVSSPWATPPLPGSEAPCAVVTAKWQLSSEHVGHTAPRAYPSLSCGSSFSLQLAVSLLTVSLQESGRSSARGSHLTPPLPRDHPGPTWNQLEALHPKGTFRLFTRGATGLRAPSPGLPWGPAPEPELGCRASLVPPTDTLRPGDAQLGGQFDCLSQGPGVYAL